MKIALLTGGGDRPYSLGLLSCLLSKDIDVDFIGSDELFDPERMGRQGVRFLNFYYKILGKKLVHTAHNINHGERDGKNSPMNRWTLKIMYGQMDHIFVHTTKMKEQLCREFSVPEVKVTVIPFGINNTVPITGMTSKEAREHLGLRESDKVLLFFGNIAAYKGLETLIHALVEVRTWYPEIRLIRVYQERQCTMKTDQD